MLFSMACVAFGQNDTSARAPRLFVGGFGRIAGGVELGRLTVPGFEGCGSFESSGSSRGWQAGLLLEVPFSRGFALELRPSAVISSGSYREPLREEPPLGLADGRVVPLMVDQVLEFESTALRLDVLASFRLPFSLRGGLGGMIERSLRLAQTHSEEIVSPDDALFAGINRRRFVFPYGSPFAAAPLVAGVSAGLAWDLPIGRLSTLSPEIGVSMPLTSQVAGGAWRSLSLSAGLALRFAIPPPSPSVPAVDTSIIDTPVVTATPLLRASITTEPAVVSVRIDEYDSVEVLPLLNHIYFSEGDDAIRPQYRELSRSQADAFTNAELTGSALDVYYHLLNIVGLRMRSNLSATLSINGYHNGRESDPALPMRRAQRIRRYLTDVWGIAPRRLKVVAGALPPNPSSEFTDQGFQENARVELVPSDPNIVGPHKRRHILRTANPPAVLFRFNTVAEAGIARWRLEVDDDGKGSWRVFTDTGTHPDSLLWNWRSDSGALPTLPMRLRYRLTVTDSTGRALSTDPADIAVTYQSVRQKLERRENDTTIESFSLLLFNFDSPKVSPSDNELLRAIAVGVKNNAVVRFVGYTDSLGDAGHNRELAMMRAREAAQIFQRLVPGDVTVIIDERGGENERFPYTTPEGRAHCRTVDIQVRTPRAEGDAAMPEDR